MENQELEQQYKDEIAHLKHELDITTEYLETTLDHVDKLEYHIHWMSSTIFWKLRTVYVRVRNLRLKNIKSLTVKGLHVLRTRGFKQALVLVLRYLKEGKAALVPGAIIDTRAYKEWIVQNEHYNSAKVALAVEAFEKKPVISIITPVYNVEKQWLDTCIDSVVKQSYPHWELCLHDDASTNPETIEALKEWEGKDSRIKISFGAVNQHICGASNSALEMATGEYVSLLDCDDAIAPHALYEFVKVINEHPDAEFIYSDEDKIDTENVRSNPFFRPDWSPYLLRSLNYITHMVCIKKTRGDAIGWFRKGYEGAQDYDLFLRLMSDIPYAHHIPKILYHWRMTDTSTSKDTSIKQYAGPAGMRALEDYLTSNEIPYHDVVQGVGMTNYHPIYETPKDALVSIIVPFKDKVELLRDCVESILSRSTYTNFELLLVTNNSTEEATFRYLKKLSDPRIRVLEYNEPFNYAAINNWAARRAKGDFLCLLNNDTKVITRNWIEEMLGLACQKDVGAVGAKLLFPDGTIQHAGVVLGMTGLAGHVFAKQKPEQTYYRMSEFTANYLAVTAACLMIETKKFWEVGGLNEEFTVCGNDVDLGLKLHEKGYYNVYCPYASLYHYESKTRDKTPPAGDFEVSKKRYAPYLNFRDPYFNPNLSLLTEAIQLRAKDEQPLIVVEEAKA